MANNRLYILDRLTGEVFPLCKAMGNGWYVGVGAETLAERLTEWMESDAKGNVRDLACGIGGEPTRLCLVDENHAHGNPGFRFPDAKPVPAPGQK